MSIQAICVLTHTSHKKCKGVIEFIEDEEGGTNMSIMIEGLKPGKHGFHIHEAGDLSQLCESACSHFNPHNTVHGGPKSKHRHVGDLGNLTAKKEGIVKKKMYDHMISLKGKHSIIGRSVVIHENPDDLGKGGLNRKGEIIDEEVHNESLKTGNAGKRIACGVIGYSHKMFKK